MKKIGALWTGKTKDKETYLNGSVEIVAGLPPVRIVVFKNKPRPGANKPLAVGAPQYNIYVSEPMKKDQAQTNVQTQDAEDLG